MKYLIFLQKIKFLLVFAKKSCKMRLYGVE